MIKANFSAYSKYVTDSLYQWDRNRTLTVTGLNLTAKPEVHFSNANLGGAIVAQAEMVNHIVSVPIPNSLLQDPLRIYAHIGIYEGDEFKVVELVEIPVIPRQRPADYQLAEDDFELYSFKRLENMINQINETWIDKNEEQIGEFVHAWLDDHPEATTTVQDGSLTMNKFVRSELGYVTPQMFGAKGDGVTDDTAALQTAINSGWPVRIPAGEYKITADLVIAADGVEIRGDGAVLHMNGNNMVAGGNSAAAVKNNFTISGVELSYGSMHIKCLNNFVVDRCKVHNAPHGVCGSHCYNGTITNSQFSDCEVGVLFDKDMLAPTETADHNVIAVRCCKFYNNTDAAFIIRGGFVGEFSFNAVEGNVRGVVVEGMADFKILSNYFEYNSSDIITLNNYGSTVNSSILISGNRIFGNANSTPKGMVLTGTIMGLILQPNSWGGLAVLIDNRAVLSGPVLLYQINNTGKEFPDFIANLRPINPGLVINSVSAEPDIKAGRMYARDNIVTAQTKLGDYVLNYKMGYVPTLNTTPKSGDGLLYLLPDGTLRIKVDGVEKTVAFK